MIPLDTYTVNYYSARKLLDHFIVVLLLLLFVMVPSSNGQQWTLIWSDDFNYQGLPDKSKWNYEKGYVRNGEKQFYTVSDLRNARVDGEHLIIEAHKYIKDGKVGYSSSSLITKDLAEWRYGRVEVRAKLPMGRGVWPAIWLLGSDSSKGWPMQGEIDIMEYVGYAPNKVYSAIHTNDRNHRKGNGAGGSLTLHDLERSFHTYAVDRFSDRIDFWIDDNLYFSYKKENDEFSSWPFDDSMYLILNLAIGGGWGGQKGIDQSIFPQKYTIDYVRVYR